MKIIYLLISLAILIGCDSDKENPITSIEKSFIIPLNVGNQWLGKAERIGNDGEIILTSYLGFSVVGKINVDSIKLSILQLENGQRFFCLNTDSGFVYSINSMNYLQYKYPASVGDQFSVSGNTFREVISTDTTINTEYGKYNCYHYSLRFYDNNFHTEQFISPNYGFIYSEHYQTDGPTPEIFLYSRITFNPILVNNK